MLEILTGPMLWLSFGIFFGGLAFRIYKYVRGLDWRLDRVGYTAHLGQGLIWALKSIGHWLLPYGARSWRKNPLFTIIFFLFHLGLIITPLFLYAHAMLLKERWGLNWIYLPASTADILTIMTLVCGLCIIIRRIALPEVRILSTYKDYLLLALSLAPFLTGFLSAKIAASSDFWLVAHIISGEILLIAVPFTRLSHIGLFFLTRAQLGMDYGIKRGGLKGRGIAW